MMIVTRKLYTYVTRDIGPVGARKIIKTDCGPVKELTSQNDVNSFIYTVANGIWYLIGRPSQRDPGVVINVFQEKVSQVDLE